MKKHHFITSLIIGIAGTAFASDPVITLSKTSVDATSSDQTIGFSTSPSNANLQIQFIQNPQNGVAVLSGWTSSGPKIYVPKGTYPGEWIIDRVDYYTADYQLIAKYSRAPISGLGESALPDAMAALTINVTNTDPDTEPPVVSAFDIDIDKLSKSNDGQFLYVPCTVTASDDKSGFYFMGGQLASSSDAVATFGIHADSPYYRIGNTDVYNSIITFQKPQTNDKYSIKQIWFRDNAGNMLYYSPIYNSQTENNFTVNRTEPIPQLFNVEIQLPDTFDDIPVRIFSGSSDSSSSASAGGGAPAQVQKAKKGGSKSSSAKKSSSSKKSSSATKKSSESKKSSAKKSGGSKKSSAKKSKGGKKSKK